MLLASLVKLLVRQVLMKTKFKNKDVLSGNIKELVKKVRQNPNLTQSDLNCSQLDYLYVIQVLSSEKFIEDFKKTGQKYICARLRPGFIGNKVTSSDNTSYIQSERGQPYGTIVAISDGNGNAAIGISYTKDEPKYHPYPVIGQATALANAIHVRDSGQQYIGRANISKEDEGQIQYFYKRALAYFNPDIYSYSRGQEDTKVKYENYDEIHQRRKMILSNA